MVLVRFHSLCPALAEKGHSLGFWSLYVFTALVLLWLTQTAVLVCGPCMFSQLWSWCVVHSWDSWLVVVVCFVLNFVRNSGEAISGTQRYFSKYFLITVEFVPASGYTALSNGTFPINSLVKTLFVPSVKRF